MRRFVPSAVLIFAMSLGAQEIDTALTAHSSPKRYTILDQIQDAAERGAFQRLYAEGDPVRRRESAVAFLQRYPASWLVAEVNEIAAKMSIELNDPAGALRFGRESLRLWPENVLLLVPLAGVEARLQQNKQAEETARMALACLDRFDRPSSVNERAWPELRNRLEASSDFILARIEASRGLAASGTAAPNGDRRAHLLAAQDWARKALWLDRSDGEAWYLAGLIGQALGDGDSTTYFAEACRRPGPSQEHAESQLIRVFAQRGAGGESFEQWVSGLKAVLPEAGISKAPQHQDNRGYAGSAVCAGCHAREYESWKETGMARMFRKYEPGIAPSDFSGRAMFRDSQGRPAARPYTEHGTPFLSVRGLDGAWSAYPVDYVIGSKWQQAYATRFPDGRIQVFPIQFNLARGAWVDYWEHIDPPGSARASVERFSSGVSTATYQWNCAPCHTSQLRLPNGEQRAATAEFAEGGINCEMCHGPSAAHVSAMRSGARAAVAASQYPVRFNRLTPAESVAICSQCHMQSGVRMPEEGGAVNFAESGEKFYRASLSRPYVDFSRQAFYKDGRFRVTTFIVESFVRSACFRKGGASCASCHDPHPANAAENPVSLKFPADSDEMCLQCHLSYRARAGAHTHHPPSSGASRCVACHMPRITEAVMFSARASDRRFAGRGDDGALRAEGKPECVSDLPPGQGRAMARRAIGSMAAMMRSGILSDWHGIVKRTLNRREALAVIAGSTMAGATALGQGVSSRGVKPVPRGKPSGIPFRAKLTDVAAQAGLTDRVIYGPADHKDYILETVGCGVAFIDYDNDGWQDLFVLCGTRLDGDPAEATNRLYKNNRDGTFADVTAKAGLLRTGWASAVTVADYNNDGFDDIFITYWGHNVLYRNNGDGTFTDVTKEAGLAEEKTHWWSGCTFVDYNRDGHLDLFVAQYLEFALKTAIPPGKDANCTWKGVPVNCGPRGLTPGKLRLYRNDGKGRFTDVSEESGIAKAHGSYAMTAVAADFDNDGWPDIYVACDSTPSYYFRNMHDGTFQEEGMLRGAALSEDGMEQAGMGVGVGDTNLDGNLDIFKTHFADDTPVLYNNDGQANFDDVTVRTGLGVETRYICWGAGIVDLDNDGLPDLFLVTGSVYPEVERKLNEYPFKTPRIVFHNIGARFEELIEEAGTGVLAPHSSRGCAFGDFDNDGDMDVLIMNMNEPPSLLRNDVDRSRNWLKVRLEGAKTNRSAIGSRVTARYGGKTQAQEVTAQASFYSVNDRRLHFGLGDAAKADLTVRWTSGGEETYRGLEANQLIVIREGTGITKRETWRRG